MPTISVIIPVYNTEKYLHRCVDSILAQTFTNYELILVDDGSTDGSGAICDEYAAKDRRIRVLHQSNQGQAAARNHALDIAKGDYIGFVDSDDWIHPRMYEILLSHAVREQADISVCGYCAASEYAEPEEIMETGALMSWTGKAYLTYCFEEKIDKKPWVLWDKLFSRSCFTGIRMPEGRVFEDNAVVYKTIYEAERIVDCDLPLYNYFFNPNSTVNCSFNKKHLDWLLVPKEMIAYFEKKQNADLLDKANRMYLYALEEMIGKVHKNLDNPELEQSLKAELKAQYRHEKKRYPITIQNNPQLFEILYPAYAKIYWNSKGILNKLKRGT